MNKIASILLLIALTTLGVRGQNSLSFYHLGNATFQNSFYNPASIPEGKVFIGLPVLSGIHLNVNNKFSYSDFVGQSETGGNKIDLELLLSNLQKNNLMSTTATFSLFHLGFSTNSGKSFSIFANERIEIDLLYPKSLMEFAINGNGSNLGETVTIGKTRLSATHFREIGLSYQMPIGKDINIGVSAKYLQGFLNVSTDGNFTADLTTDSENYSLNLDLSNATLLTSGLGIYQGENGNIGEHLIMNGNRGAAIDLGFHYDLNRFSTISASIVDLGFISWKDDIKNHTFGDTTMVYSGIDLSQPDNLEQQIEDSLINKFKDRLTETQDSFTSLTSPRVFVSWTYHTPKGGDFIATGGTRYIQGQMKTLFGAGYRHKVKNFLVGSINVTKLPQQFLNLGAGLSLKGGPVQMYLAVDQVMNFDLTRFQAFDFRFGINFVFGKRDKEILASQDNGSSGSKRTKTTNGSFLGSKVDVKGQEGIYTIINKQSRRSKDEYDVRVKPKKNKRTRKKDIATSSTQAIDW